MRWILLMLSPFVAVGAARAQDMAACVIPNGTPMRIMVDELVSSKTAKIGDTFAIRLASDISVGGERLLPAGLTGRGEVIHASKGKALTRGELILGARFLMLGDIKIPLRGFRINNAAADYYWRGTDGGKPTTLYQGQNAFVPAGARAEAKAAGDIAVPCPNPAATP